MTEEEMVIGAEDVEVLDVALVAELQAARDVVADLDIAVMGARADVNEASAELAHARWVVRDLLPIWDKARAELRALEPRGPQVAKTQTVGGK